MTAGFSGFPDEFFDFFRDLAKHNDREWFTANKQRFKDSVQAPISAFIEAMDPRLHKLTDCFVTDPRPNGGSMFRIYRDVRFSRDKRPYKENAACQFRHISGKDAHAPGFYMHFEPDNVFFGGGIWMAPTPVLTKIRSAIVDDPEGWKQVTRSAAFRRHFEGVSGDGLKRAPAGFDPDHPLIEDLRRKSFFAMRRTDETLAKSSSFTTEVAKSFKVLAPFMEFLTSAVGLPFTLDS